MKKKNQGITLIALIITIIVLVVFAGVSISTLTGEKGIIKQAEEAVDEAKQAQIAEQEELNKIFSQLESNEETNINIDELGVGWNLGNSLDCHDESSKLTVEQYETLWHNPRTTKEMIEMIKENGFKSILIPVTWFNHVDSDNNIDKEWMARVKEVVDYAIDCDMYVVLNTHHDDKKLGLEKNELEFEKSIAKYKKIWQQIANTFKDYPSKLIFEVLNEPRAIVNGEDVWTPTDLAVYNNLNKISIELLETIRDTGKNNKNRYVLLPTYGTLITKDVLNNLELPQDKHIAISVHGYITHDYCSESGTTFNDEIKEEIEYKVQLMSKFSKEKNVPVVFTELGVEEKEDRNEWIKNMYFQAARENIPILWWDNGKEYAIFDRNELKVKDQTAIDTMREYYYKTKDLEKGKNAIDNINYTKNNVEYSEGNMGIKEVNGKNRYFVNMTIPKYESVRFKFADVYELNDEKVFLFSCKIKTNMNALKIKYVLNFYDDEDNLIYKEDYSDMSKELVDGSKTEYEFKKILLIDGAKKVKLERINVQPFYDGEPQDVNFEIYDIALKCK